MPNIYCGECDEKILTTMLKHLKDKHPEIYKRIEHEEKAQKQN